MTTLHFRKPAGYPFIFISGDLAPDLITALDKTLSYTLKNAEYAIAALADRHARENQERRDRGEALVEYPPWDGRIHFLKQSKKNGVWFFPVGLVERAKKLLSWYDVEVMEDLRYDECGIEGEFEWYGPELRDYQLAVLPKIIKAGGGIIQLPTASGKTTLFLKLVYAMGLNTIIFVHREELFKQWGESISKYFGFRAEVVSKGIWVFSPLTSEVYKGPTITLAMIQTIYSGVRGKNKNANFVLDSKYDLAGYDEVHHLAADTFYAVATKIDAKHSYGLSATVERENKDELKVEAATGPVIVKMDAAWLIEHGYLTTPVFRFLDVPATHVTGRTFPQIYRSGIVLNQDRNNAIANCVKELVSEGRQVLIHVEQITHGQILSELMKVPFVYSKSKNRQETIETFKKGYTRVLCSTVLGEGFDLPSISAVCMAGGRKTEAGTIQKIGRALRPDEKFKTAIIVDFVDRGGRYLADHAMKRYETYVKFYGEKLVHGGKK